MHGDTKTPGSDAVLPLPEIGTAALTLRAKEQAEAKASAGPFWVESDLVFTTEHGTPVDPRSRHPPHVASLLAALDVHPEWPCRFLRHSEIAVTMEVYAQVPSEATRMALKRLGESLGEMEDS